MDPNDRILPYLSPPVKKRRWARSTRELRFGPGTGLFIAIVAFILSTTLADRHGDVLKHFLAIFLVAIACASSAAGCVVGFGNHDNGYLPIRKQIFGGIVGLIDLVMTFAAVLALAGLLTF